MTRLLLFGGLAADFAVSVAPISTGHELDWARVAVMAATAVGLSAALRVVRLALDVTEPRTLEIASR